MRLPKFSIIACLGIVLSLCCPFSKAEAIFASVKSMGMGAAAIAYPLDSLGAAYNPANLVCVGNRLDLEFGWLHDTGTVRIRDNLVPIPGVNGSFEGIDPENYFTGAFGFASAWCCECFNWSFGVIGYNRYFQKTHFERPLPLFGTSKTGFEFIDYTVAPVFAIQLWECLDVGVSIDWQIERVKVTGLENFDNETLSLHPGHVTNRGHEYAHGVTATFGARWKLGDSLAIGATYRPKTHMSKLDRYDGFFVDGKLDIPEQVGIGIAVWPFPCLPCFVVAFDWEWIHWSNIHGLSNTLLHNNTFFALGTESGPAFGFRDQNIFRVGFEYYYDDWWSVRVGFQHANSPVRSSETFFNLLTLDCVENWVTVGLTWRYDCWNEFSAFGAYGFEHEINGENVIPLIPFGGGDVRLKERKYAVGLAWGWKF